MDVGVWVEPHFSGNKELPKHIKIKVLSNLRTGEKYMLTGTQMVVVRDRGI